MLYPCIKTCFSLSHTDFSWLPIFYISWGSHRFGFFGEDYQDTHTVEVWFLFLSIHISQSVLFSPTLNSPIFSQSGGCCASGLASPLSLHPFLYVETVFAVSLSSSIQPPPHHLPLKCQVPSLPSFLMCDRLYSTLNPETAAEASTVDLPLTHFPILLSPCYTNDFSVLSLSPIKLEPSCTFFSCSFPFLESMVSHIWPRLVWVTNSQTSFCFIFKFQLGWCFTGISLEFKLKVPKKWTLFLTIIPPSFSCSLGSPSSSHSNEIVRKMPHNIRYSWLATLSTTCFSALPLLLCCSFYYWNLSVTGSSNQIHAKHLLPNSEHCSSLNAFFSAAWSFIWLAFPTFQNQDNWLLGDTILIFLPSVCNQFSHIRIKQA